MLSILTKKNPQKNTRTFLEVMDMFIILVVMRYHGCMHTKLIKLYTLCISFCIVFIVFDKTKKVPQIYSDLF